MANAQGRVCLSTEEFIISLFCRVDEAMAGEKKHPQACLYPSETVTLAILFVIKGAGERTFYRWISRDWRGHFPRLPERTRLFRLFAAHQDWARRFLAGATVFGVADSFGIKLIETRRLNRSPRQIARKGYCGARWIAGVKLGAVINGRGEICAWDVATANAYDANAFAPLIAAYDGRMIVLADGNFHKSPHHRPQDPDPPNLKVCPRHTWNERRTVETVFSMLNGLCSLNHLTERTWPSVRAHLGFVAAALNLLLNWDGHPNLSIARFSL